MNVTTGVTRPHRFGRARLVPRLGNPSLRFGVSLLAVMVLLGCAGQLLLADPNRQNLVEAGVGPGSDGHLLGTDALGRDILAWISSSILVSLTVCLGVVGISAAVGVTVGLVAGYARGFVDAALMRIVDLSLAVPPLVLFIAAAVAVEPGLVSLILLLSSVAWIPYARLVRAKVLTDRQRGFVAAARLAGMSRTRILALELLPGVSTLLLVMASLQAGYVLLWEAGLSFLGLGIQAPQTSLGYMIAQGQTSIGETWWVVVFPGVAIMLLVLAMNLIGDGLRDRFQLDTEAMR